jgi:hypothetical protein
MLTKMGMPDIKDLDGSANRGYCQLLGNYGAASDSFVAEESGD